MESQTSKTSQIQKIPKSKQPPNPNVQKFEILKLHKKKAENPPDIKNKNPKVHKLRK